MNPVRIAILDMYNRHPNQGMRGIKQIVEEQVFPNEWKVFDVRTCGELPGTDYDIYISSGGPGCPITGVEDWDKRWCALMDAIRDHNKKPGVTKKFVFLICHSFQMLVHHWDLAEITKRKSPAFGIFPMHKSVAGECESLLGQLPEPFYAVDSRDWQVVQPVKEKLEQIGATVLCIEKDRPHIPLERAAMGIRFSDEMIGFQFHPEADEFGMNLYMHRPERRKQIVDAHGEEKYQEMITFLKDKSKIHLTYSTILPGFLRYAVTNLRNCSW